MTDQTATYTSFEKVSTLTEGVYSATFIYNSDNQRAKMTVTQSGNTILTRWYIGNSYIKEVVGGVTKEYNFIGGDVYTAPVVAVIQSGTITYYYLLRDHLGNITHQVNTSNTVVAEYNFDAWGRRRSADDWSYTMDANDLALFADRGFTGHEHLSLFNLVNMNGRLYDPLIGRFLNADPYVQIPDYSQNFNRYSYCINNPLKYNDQEGEWFGVDDLVEFVVGGVVNVMFNANQIDNFWEGLAYFGSGGVGTWISVQSFGLAAPVGAAISSFGNSMLETNFLTKENGYSFKSIDKEEWKKIGLKTGIGAVSGWAGDKIGGKLADKVQDKLHITSEFWTEASSKMIENGITDGLGNYLNSTIIDHSGWVSKEAFKNLGMGIGEGIAKGMTSTLLNQKWARPELQKFKELGLVLDIKKNSWKESNLKFLYNPLLPPKYRIPSPPKLYIPNSNN
ncbi:MAG: RHS repeat-associated core domain-containing protein [Bacteroidota bacterium]|nr:RHS repeat-associated core domain-containing protein [Bacteroidota bacterium]